jgi:hypothetical protein
VASPTTQLLDGVALVSPTEGWAMGFNRTFLHYTDGRWSLAASHHDNLFGLTMVSATEGWAVGNGPFGDTILHYTTG